MNRFVVFIKYALYAPLVLPLLITPFTFLGAHFGKTMFFQLVIDGILIVCLVLLALGKITIDWSVFRWRALNWLDRSVLIFLGALLVTSFTGIYPAISFWGNLARENGALLWLHFGVWYFLLKYFWVPVEWRRGFLLSTLVATIVAVTGFFQNILPKSFNLIVETDRLVGILGNANHFSLYLVPALGMALVAASLCWTGTWKTAWKTILALGGAAIIAAAIVYAQTRGSFIGLAAGLLTALVLLVIVAHNKKVRRLSGVLLAIILIGGFGLSLFARTDSAHQNFPVVARFFDVTSFARNTGETRIAAWGIALQGLRERPLLGWGLNSYEAIYSKYYNPIFLRYTFSETVWDKPHNWFLEMADSGGVIGFVSYSALLVIGFILALRGKKKQSLSQTDSNQKDHGVFELIPVTLAATLVAYAVQLLFLFETTGSLLLFFFLLAAISARFTSVEEEKISFVQAGTLARAMCGVVGFAVLFGAYKGSVLPLQASYYLQRAVSASTPSDLASSASKTLSVPAAFQGESAVFLAEHFVRLNKAGVSFDAVTLPAVFETAEMLHRKSLQYPRTIAYPIWEAQLYEIIGEKEGEEKYLAYAEAAAKQAAALSPNKQDVLFVLGRIYLLEKKFTEAIEVQKKAVAADESVAVSHWFLGLGYQVAGKKTEALEEIETAQRLGLVSSLNEQLYILDLYANAQQYDKAIAGYVKLLETNPDNTVNWYIRLAALYAAKGDKATALEYAEKAAALSPEVRPAAEQFIKENHLR